MLMISNSRAPQRAGTLRLNLLNMKIDKLKLIISLSKSVLLGFQLVNLIRGFRDLIACPRRLESSKFQVFAISESLYCSPKSLLHVIGVNFVPIAKRLLHVV